MNQGPHNNFKQRLNAGEPLIGTFVKTPSMMVAEVLSLTELDVVCIDAEHSPYDRADIDRCIMAYRASQKPSLVRVPSGTQEHILNALDCGATGVVIPHVDSVEKATACAVAAKFGNGGRGYAGSTRAASYTGKSIDENLAINYNENVVIAQIEDLAALDCIDEIAAVDGIDCLFIGMMDLTVALGAKDVFDIRVVDAAEKICKVAQGLNRRTGIFVPNADAVPFWLDRGVSLFLMGSDHNFIKQGADTLSTAVKNCFN